MDLKAAGISFITRNNNESAKMAGFGISNDNVEIYVYKKDFEKASKILNLLKREIDSKLK